MTRDEYDDAAGFIKQVCGIECPAARDLRRGGIIGSVEVVDVVNDNDSPWFFGPRGLVLARAEECEFIPSVGALGYFKWLRAPWDITPPPAKWMLPVGQSDSPTPKPDEKLPDLFEAAS